MTDEVSVAFTLKEADVLLEYISVSLTKVKTRLDRVYGTGAPEHVARKVEDDLNNLHTSLAKVALALTEPAA